MQKRLINSIKQHSKRYLQYKYNYSPKNDNTFQLYSEGSQFYPAMLEAIEKATHSIYLIQYIFETSITTTRFINVLIQAKQRGVNVYLILDAYGSKGLSTQERMQLRSAGISIYFFNPLKNHHLIKFLYRDHRKLLVIDTHTAFLGGACISDDYDYPLQNTKGWRDLVIQVNGSLSQDCVALFNQQLSLAKENYSFTQTQIKATNLTLQNNQVRLLTSKSWHRNEIQRAIIHATKKSSKRIWITTPYFVPTRKLKKLLKLAAYRGCDVRLLLPGKDSDHPWINQVARQLYSRLLKNSIKIFEYQARFTHAKAILCDDWACIGSSNLDKWNQKFNLELNVEVQAPELTKQLADFFEQGFNDSIQINPTEWESRSRLQRIREWFWSKIAIWLERFIHNLR